MKTIAYDAELMEARIAMVSQQVTKAEFYQAIKEMNDRLSAEETSACCYTRSWTASKR